MKNQWRPRAVGLERNGYLLPRQVPRPLMQWAQHWITQRPHPDQCRRSTRASFSRLKARINKLEHLAGVLPAAVIEDRLSALEAHYNITRHASGLQGRVASLEDEASKVPITRPCIALTIALHNFIQVVSL
jgi:hypothetical protein